MNEKHRRKIIHFAKESLKSKLLNEIKPYLNHIPIEINDIINEKTKNFHILEEDYLESKERLGPRLQSLGRDLADGIFPEVKIKAIPVIQKNIEKRRTELAAEKDRTAKVDSLIDILRKKVEKGSIGKRRHWRGADVIVTPEPIPNDRLGWSHSNDIQVVTHSEELAQKISWMLIQARDIMSPFLDYHNKYMFYGELAQAANLAISSNGKDNEPDILAAMVNRLEEFKTEWMQTFMNYFQKEQQLMNQAEKFIIENSPTQNSGTVSEKSNRR